MNMKNNIYKNTCVYILWSLSLQCMSKPSPRPRNKATQGAQALDVFLQDAQKNQAAGYSGKNGRHETEISPTLQDKTP